MVKESHKISPDPAATVDNKLTRKQNGESIEALDPENDTDRGTWGNQCEFFLSCLGYAVGFGNVWRFPYLCYKNGGAVFLIPYVIMLLCAGLPLFFMELALGQYVSLGPNILFPNLAPIFSGLGWAMLFISLLVAIYYNVILAWTLYYTFASFTSVLPWSHCENSFNSKNCFTEDDAKNCTQQGLFFYAKKCLDIGEFCGVANTTSFNSSHCFNPSNRSLAVKAASIVPRISASEDYFKNGMLRVTGTSWDNMGGMNWEIAGCLLLAWIIVGLCMIKGVKSSGKVVYFTALFPYAVLIILLIRGVTLEGAQKGITFYILKPNTTKLMEAAVWNDAATQIFYSLGSSFGGLITLASYNKLRNNCMRDAITIAFSNCATSVFAGFVIFSIMGFMATELGVEVGDVVSSGSGLAFIAYPAAVARMPLPPLWALLFFFMLITLGLDSQFTMVETLTTALFDQFQSLRSRKPLVVLCMCIVLYLCGLTMCLEGGIYMFELFNWYSAGLSVVILALTEIILVQYVYGFKNFMRNIQQEIGIWIPRPLYGYWAATWLVITPLSLTIIFGFSVYYYEPAYFGDYVYPSNIQALGWMMFVAAVGMLPVFALWVYFRSDKRGWELFKTTEDFCPASVRQLRETRGAAFKGKESFRYTTYDNEAYSGGEGISKVYPRIPSADDPPPYNKESTAEYTNHM